MTENKKEQLRTLTSGNAASFNSIEKTKNTGFIEHDVFQKVGATGFEPATSASRTQRSTKLSHAPMDKIYQLYNDT